jgi:hypothetical protein
VAEEKLRTKSLSDTLKKSVAEEKLRSKFVSAGCESKYLSPPTGESDDARNQRTVAVRNGGRGEAEDGRVGAAVQVRLCRLRQQVPVAADRRVRRRAQSADKVAGVEADPSSLWLTQRASMVAPLRCLVQISSVLLTRFSL